MDPIEGVEEHQRKDLENPSPPPGSSGLLTLSPDTGWTIDERLSAVIKSIRERDWRAGLPPPASAPPLGPGPKTPSARPEPAGAPRTPTPPLVPGATALRTMPPAPAPLSPPGRHGEPTRPDVPAARVQPDPGMVTQQLRALPIDSPPPAVQAPPTRTSMVPLPPVRLLPPEPESESGSGLGVTHESETVTTPEATAEEAAPSTHHWPKNLGKIVLVVVTILVVVVIIAIIRKSADNPSSGSLTPTSVTHKKSDPSATTPTIPVSSAVSSAFTTASADLDAANATVTRELAGGASQPVSQVAQEVAPYVTALNTFTFQTHFLPWPSTLQVPSEDLTLRVNELIHYLSSVSTSTPATLPSWFAQFHALTRVTQEEDNTLRRDLGLPTTTSFPTK